MWNHFVSCVLIFFRMALVCSYLDHLYISAAALPLRRHRIVHELCTNMQHVRYSCSFFSFSAHSFILCCILMSSTKACYRIEKGEGFHRRVLLKFIKSYFKAWELFENFRTSKCDERNKSWGMSNKIEWTMEKGV